MRGHPVRGLGSIGLAFSSPTEKTETFLARGRRKGYRLSRRNGLGGHFALNGGSAAIEIIGEGNIDGNVLPVIEGSLMHLTVEICLNGALGILVPAIEGIRHAINNLVLHIRLLDRSL